MRNISKQIKNIPPVQLLHCRTPGSMDNTHQVSENSFPHTEFKLVQHVYYQHQKEIESEYKKPIRKGIL
jgi:hypothetical protein